MADPVGIAFLNRLGEANPNLRLVISSVWRSSSDIVDILHAWGLDIRMFRDPRVADVWLMRENEEQLAHNIRIGMITDFETGIRGLQIDRWMKKFGETVERWAIIDDDSDMLPEQADHFVKTNGQVGICIEAMDKLKKLLIPDGKLLKM